MGFLKNAKCRGCGSSLMKRNGDKVYCFVCCRGVEGIGYEESKGLNYNEICKITCYEPGENSDILPRLNSPYRHHSYSSLHTPSIRKDGTIHKLNPSYKTNDLSSIMEKKTHAIRSVYHSDTRPPGGEPGEEGGVHQPGTGELHQRTQAAIPALHKAGNTGGD